MRIRYAKCKTLTKTLTVNEFERTTEKRIEVVID